MRKSPPFLFAITLLLATPALLSARTPRRGFDLFADAGIWLQANRVQCSINGVGELCVSLDNSPVQGGGFWPAGTNDQYVFNQGLQVAGLIAGTPQTGFPWPGDTVGAYFFDARGDQAHGENLIGPLNSLDPADRLRWPSVARANDPSLFAAPLLGRLAVSDQDVFVRFWDGNLHLSSGRAHPAGLLVDMRAVAWNNDALRDMVFFIYRVINISASTPQTYQRLASAGYDAEAIAGVAQLGARFQSTMEAQYGLQIPDSGYTLRDAYLGFGQDADIGQAGSNYSNANQVFQSLFAYKSDFREPSWAYPPEVFGPPQFAAAPGFVGEAFVRTPRDTTGAGAPAGLWMTSNLANGAFPTPIGTARLWRALSLNLLPSDGSCSVPSPKARHMCWQAQGAGDTRIYSSTGPTTLDPGQSAVFIVAQVHAAPVDSAVRPFIGGNLVPGLPVAGDRLLQGLDTVRAVDRVAGWRSYSDINGNGRIEWDEVTTVPRSLYANIQAARVVANAGFLQPQVPAAPQFFVVPDDGRATVVWQKSPDEDAGDPYFAVTSNPASRLYDPSYRRFDVEGYRVWRGTSPTSMRMVAQYDYQGTALVDYAGRIWNGAAIPACAPELGSTAFCPTFPNTVPLNGDVIQFRFGDRLLLSNGGVALLHADTAVTGNASGRLPLADTRVPFVFSDSGLTNGQTYYYAVTTFDVNSFASGPSTMESGLMLRSVTPRVAASGTIAGAATVELIGRSGNPLPAGTMPTLDALSGIFSGPMPPANALSVGFLQFLPDLVEDGATILTVDSVVPGSWFTGQAPAVYWFSATGNMAPQKFSVPILGASTERTTDITATGTFVAAALSTSAVAPSGGDSTFSLAGYATVAVNGSFRYTNQYRGLINGNPAAGTSAGPRWWVGSGNENVADPNGINCLTTPAGFSCTLADLSRNAGAIAGVGIMNIASYGTIGTTEPIRTVEGITSGIFRAADFKWYWGNSGSVDSVIDVVHDVPVPFSPKIRASWGILNDSSFLGHVVNKQLLGDTSVTRLTWADAACVAPAPLFAASCGGVANFTGSDSGAVLMNHARLSPVNFASSTYPGVTALPAAPSTGVGFILYLDGHFFLMQMAGLPAQGTVWNMRTYAGNVTGSVGSYKYVPATRPAAVPGLRVRISYTGSSRDTTVTTASQLAAVHTVPDPFYYGNSTVTGGREEIRFVNLPQQAIIRIYSLRGGLVSLINHNDATGGGEAAWNLRGRDGGVVPSGVYLYHVEAADGATRVGRFTVVNSR